MKIIRLLILTSLALLLSGCMKEDMSECILEGDLTLTFTLPDKNGKDRFSAHIDAVEVLIFNNEGRFLMHKTVSKKMLGEFQGLKMTLPAGTYNLMCWGNVLDNSRFSQFVPDVTLFEECSLEIPHTSTQTGDQVYYAPHKEKPSAFLLNGDIPELVTKDIGKEYEIYKINIPAGENVTKNLPFIRAHRTVHVYTQNLNNAPRVSIKNLWSKYNFFFETQDLCYDFTRSASVEQISGVDYHIARFHSALGLITADVDIDILSSVDDRVLHRVNMLQFVKENPPADTDDIHILVTFLDNLGITVTIPSWLDKPINPGVH